MKKKIATTIVTLGLLFMAALPATADAAVPKATDLSSVAAITAYLTSIGVDPGTVVIQQGRFNYAGPSCPGAGWNCTTATKVVQISSATSPGANIFDCLPALDATFPALNECLIVQSSVLSVLDPPPPNSATCTPTFSSDGKTRSKCTIRQSSKKGNNYAEVRASMTQSGGTTQSATQEGSITQTSEAGDNTAKITMTIQQTLSFGGNEDPMQTQDAHQTANVSQTSGTGNNSSDVQLTQLQSENATANAAITQAQNTDMSSGFNQDATVSQMSTSGNNSSNLTQRITQGQSADAKACGASCTVKQTQSSTTGGHRGKVNQSTATDPSLTNKSVANQIENQTQDAEVAALAAPPLQQQFGPEDCCATQIGGGPGNVNTVSLVNNQHQTVEDLQSTNQSAHCVGGAGQNCTASISYTSNNGTTQMSVTGPAASCTNSGGEVFCSPGGGF
jgi:hypothetical protein